MSAPTTNRHYRVTADASSVYTGLAAGAAASVDATDTLSYQSIVDIVTLAKTNYVKPLMAGGKSTMLLLFALKVLHSLRRIRTSSVLL